MENYKVELTFHFELDYFPHFCIDDDEDCYCKNYYEDDEECECFCCDPIPKCDCEKEIRQYLKNNYSKCYESRYILKKKVIIGSFNLSHFDKENRMRFKDRYKYDKVLKNSLPDIYVELNPKFYSDISIWNIKFPKYEIEGHVRLIKVELLKRPPKVIFKKVFANIVLKSLLNDIYKPDSKRFQKCQERFLENSKQLCITCNHDN